ncbi:MAG: hypothetical protein Q9157_004078 [Trypethelium eluteriae]
MSTMIRSLTLREYLTTANPTLQLAWISEADEEIDKSPPKKKKKKNKPNSASSTKNESYPELETVSEWKEFTLETIIELFGGSTSSILNRTYDLQDFSQTHPCFHQISDEDSLEALLIKHTQSTILEALQKTTNTLLDQEVTMVRGGQASLFHLDRPDSKIKLRPDWAGRCYLRAARNILPGETKPSRVFSSRVLRDCVDERDQVKDPNADCLWPARQVAAYCAYSHMRYGYIITDEELIVVRIGTLLEQRKNTADDDLMEDTFDKPRFEWQSIPWNHGDDGAKITVNLALWALHVLAASNGLLDWKYSELSKEKIKRREEQRPLQHAATSSFETDMTESQNERRTEQERGEGGDSDAELESPTRNAVAGPSREPVYNLRRKPQQSFQSQTSTVPDSDDEPFHSQPGSTQSSFANRLQEVRLPGKRQLEEDEVEARKIPRHGKSKQKRPLASNIS